MFVEKITRDELIELIQQYAAPLEEYAVAVYDIGVVIPEIGRLTVKVFEVGPDVALTTPPTTLEIDGVPPDVFVG
jgi:hypothetical protein